jgi:hypothetical protein
LLNKTLKALSGIAITYTIKTIVWWWCGW